MLQKPFLDAELWNLVKFPLKSDLEFGLWCSQISFVEQACRGKLFFKSYTGTSIAPLKNFFDVSRVDDSGYMKVNSHYLKLKILDPKIEVTPGVRTNLKLMDYYQSKDAKTGSEYTWMEEELGK
jgi:hypothetical protein